MGIAAVKYSLLISALNFYISNEKNKLHMAEQTICSFMHYPIYFHRYSDHLAQETTRKQMVAVINISNNPVRMV